MTHIYMFHRNIGHSMHHFWYISPNKWQMTFLTLNTTFRLIPHRIGFTTKKLHDAINLNSICYYQKISIFMENGPNLTFPTLNMTFWIHLLTVYQYHPRKDVYKSANKLSDRFWENYQNYLWVIASNPSFGSPSASSWEASCQNGEKVSINQFLRKLPIWHFLPL